MATSIWQAIGSEMVRSCPLPSAPIGPQERPDTKEYTFTVSSERQRGNSYGSTLSRGNNFFNASVFGSKGGGVREVQSKQKYEDVKRRQKGKDEMKESRG